MSLRASLPIMMKDAMKARDQVRLDTVRFILSQAKNQEIDLKRELNDDELLTLLKREVKNRQEAIDQFSAAGRNDIVSEEESKLAIIKELLPAEMSDEDLSAKVEQIVAGLEDKSFGSAMKAVMAELKGQADGKKITQAVKKVVQG